MPHDPYRVAIEIREQLASADRRSAFFLGAGSSMAIGMPGIQVLSSEVEASLDGEYQEHYARIRKEIAAVSNVEEVLDRVRLLREWIGDSEEKEISGVKGAKTIKRLDNAICRKIAEIVARTPQDESPLHRVFAQWIGAIHTRRSYPVEIFTTNYDLLLERALEDAGVPFFDGFVGVVHPFFAPETVEADHNGPESTVCPPRGWTRLWKLHGSINWRLRQEVRGKGKRITRVHDQTPSDDDELVVFPSRDKYSESRKLPFLAFQDRLRRFLSSGECLLVVVGYSFSDQHINEVLLQALRTNPHLAVNVLVYGDPSEKRQARTLPLPMQLVEFGKQFRNLSAYGPDQACIGGRVDIWGEPSEKHSVESFWAGDGPRFTLGDFKSFTHFLDLFIGLTTHTQSAGTEAPEPPG